MRKIFLLVLRLALLTVLYFILFAVCSALLIPRITEDAAPADQSNVFLALLTVSLANTCVLSFLILRSRLSGWKLALIVFLFFFGTAVVMPQIETAIFVTQLPAGMLRRIVLSGFFLAFAFSFAAVPILGKHRHSSAASDVNLSSRQWFTRLTLIGLLYVVVYFTFGYFIAWQSPAVRAYYHGTDPGTFFTQLKSVFRETPWLFLLQFLRGVLWAIIAFPLIRTLKGTRWQIGLAMALAFAVCTSSQLLIPNPLMPYAVRMAHLLETSTSNFLFGWIVAAFLTDQSQRH